MRIVQVMERTNETVDVLGVRIEIWKKIISAGGTTVSTKKCFWTGSD